MAAAYALDQLLDDAAKLPGVAARHKALNFKEVFWSIDRYIAQALEHGRGVSSTNLCRIGWQVQHLNGKDTMKPYFQLSEAFCRNIGIDPHPPGIAEPSRDIRPMEELNFSKAAIKFSGKLTKNEAFTGWRLMVRQLSEVIKQGRAVNLEFSFGKLIAKDRAVHFVFAPELYVANGLKVPECVVTQGAEKTSATFSAGDSAQLQGLNLKGTGMKDGLSRSRGIRPVAQAATDGWAYVPSGNADVLTLSPNLEAGYTTDAGCNHWLSSGNATGASTKRTVLSGSCTGSGTGSAAGQRAAAYDSALHAHITDLEVMASEKVRERFLRDSDANQHEEEDAIAEAARRAKCREHAAFLQQQIETKANNRAQPASDLHELERSFRYPALSSRQEKLEASHQKLEKPLSSSTVTRNFDKLAPASAREARAPNAFRDALDSQVLEKQMQKEKLQNKQRRFEHSQVTADREELQAFQDYERETKAYERECLAAGWDEQRKFKEMFQAVTSNPGKTLQEVAKARSSCSSRGTCTGGSRSTQCGTPRSQLPPGSARGNGSGYGLDSIGAAASLALQIRPAAV